eukprot:UN25629
MKSSIRHTPSSRNVLSTSTNYLYPNNQNTVQTVNNNSKFEDFLDPPTSHNQSFASEHRLLTLQNKSLVTKKNLNDYIRDKAAFQKSQNTTDINNNNTFNTSSFLGTTGNRAGNPYPTFGGTSSTMNQNVSTFNTTNTGYNNNNNASFNQSRLYHQNPSNPFGFNQSMQVPNINFPTNNQPVSGQGISGFHS